MESYAEAGMSAQQLIGIFDLIFSGHNIISQRQINQSISEMS